MYVAVTKTLANYSSLSPHVIVNFAEYSVYYDMLHYIKTSASGRSIKTMRKYHPVFLNTSTHVVQTKQIYLR